MQDIPHRSLPHPAHWGLFCLALLAACANNHAPELFPIEPQTAHVGSRFELRLSATDQDGDKLTFGYSSPTVELGNRARLFDLGGEAIFTWTPIASDVGSHQVDFTVSDGEAEDLESVSFTIKAATNPNTAPIFRKPLNEGTTLDLSVSKCLKQEVLVEDPDSVKVEISQDPPIPGSQLQTVGPLQAFFDWCPTTAQASQSVFVLRLVADDKDNPPVRKNFTILVRSALPQNCPGTAPTIQHTPPASQTTVQDITLEASVSDDKGLKGDPVVYYTEVKPSDPTKLDFASMDQLTMSSAGGTNYEADLPNPTTALNPGESVTVYYVIVAEDDDDATGNCDHRSQLPKDAVFELTVTRPTQSTTCTTSADCKAAEMCKGQTCVADTCTPTDDNGDQLFWEQSDCPTGHFCPESGSTTSHCAQTCTSDSDCKAAAAKCKVFDTKKGCGQAGAKLIGRECTDFTECEGKAMCMPWPAGYCSISDCDSYGGFSGACPTGAACVPLVDARFSYGTHWVCLQLCKDNNNCRTGDGYSCKTMTDDTGTSQNVCFK